MSSESVIDAALARLEACDALELDPDSTPRLPMPVIVGTMVDDGVIL